MTKQPVVAFLKSILGLFIRTVHNVLQDHWDAEDVVSETFQQALRKLHTLKDPTALQTWLCRIGYRYAVSRKRRSPRALTVESLDGISHEGLVLPAEMAALWADETARDSKIKQERLELLIRLIRSLPPRDSQVMELYYFEGLKQAEIAVFRFNTSRVIRSAGSHNRFAAILYSPTTDATCYRLDTTTIIYKTPTW